MTGKQSQTMLTGILHEFVKKKIQVLRQKANLLRKSFTSLHLDHMDLLIMFWNL